MVFLGLYDKGFIEPYFGTRYTNLMVLFESNLAYFKKVKMGVGFDGMHVRNIRGAFNSIFG